MFRASTQSTRRASRKLREGSRAPLWLSCLLVCACSAPHRPPQTGAPKSTAAAAPSGASTVGTYLHLRIPLFGEAFSSTPLASVDGEPITVGQVVNRLIASGGHGQGLMSHPPGGAESDGKEQLSKKVALSGRTLGRKQYEELLQRMIDTRLMLAEARNIGIDQLPAVKAAIERTQRRILRQMLETEITKDLKPDKNMAQSLYEHMVRQWKLSSLIFKSKSKAKRMLAKLKRAGKFDELAKAARLTGDAQGAEQTEFVATDKLLPNVLQAVRSLKAGELAPLVQVKQGWVVLRVEAVRHPEDQAARLQAERQAFATQRRLQLETYFAKQVKRLVKQDLRLVSRLDLAAKKPGLEALLKDKRVLAEMEGRPPITVGDLVSALTKKYYHGVSAAAREKRIDRDKLPTFKKLVERIVVQKRAEELGLMHRAEYKKRIEEAEAGLLVGTFIQRMVASGISVTDGEGKRYYKENIADYSFPAFYKLKSIGFTTLAAARAAKASLDKGTEFAWMKTNGSNLAAENMRELVDENKTFSAKGLDDALMQLISGAKVGEYRVYSKGDVHYVVQIKEHLPAKPRPYIQVRKAILQRLSEIKLNKQMKSWTEKLRKAYPVRLYVQQISTGSTGSTPSESR